jgi:hypothetical protein
MYDSNIWHAKINQMSFWTMHMITNIFKKLTIPTHDTQNWQMTLTITYDSNNNLKPTSQP